MPEWSTYTLSDFLMFAPRTYWRLVEQYNRDLWPAHLLALAAACASLCLARTRQAWAGRAVAALLAAAWLWVGWAFHAQRYATINWAAQYVAAAFALQALLLLGLAWLRPGPWAARSVGWWVAAAGAVLYPFAGLAAGRPWTQAEVAGIAPEPTALVTLGLLLAHGGLGLGMRFLLAAIPLLSLLLGAATLLAMAQ
jgi:hypothetical protein